MCYVTGKFDFPDRMFSSIRESWDSCLNNYADVKELIPEFFTGSGNFLINSQDLNLGIKQNGDVLNNVELPLWCINNSSSSNSNEWDVSPSPSLTSLSPMKPPATVTVTPQQRFIDMNRQALESDYVSAHLHQWIDLIFG